MVLFFNMIMQIIELFIMLNSIMVLRKMVYIIEFIDVDIF